MPKTASKKILIVDDEKPLAKALELKLSHAGFETHVANNGEDAINALKKESFSLMLLDLIMPKMDGFKVLEEMKKLKKKPPVIVLSNLSQSEDMDKAKKLGAKGFFIKSDTSLAEVVKQVNTYL